MERLEKHYQENVIAKLKEKFQYSSAMQIPKVKKVVLNMGLGEAIQNNKSLEYAEYALTQISGQKPVFTKAKKAIANFKLREGIPIGCMVTLRGKRMYEFMDRLISVALPRVKDFRGVSAKGFDGRGNYSMGIKEQIVFPEVNLEKLDKVRGLNISFVTSATTDEEGRELLRELGIPFKKANKPKEAHEA
ncbi:MAG: 50S ribosomal protein L5 [Deltaproteobacteria bacterium]|nr:50S ribosomal protein L5 [Deltaproteobacteria bacterium]